VAGVDLKLRRGSATKPADADYQQLGEHTIRFMWAQREWEPYSGNGLNVEVLMGGQRGDTRHRRG